MCLPYKRHGLDPIACGMTSTSWPAFGYLSLYVMHEKVTVSYEAQLNEYGSSAMESFQSTV